MTAARILVVEDEVLIGMDLVMLLEDWGYRPDGPHGSVAACLEAVEQFDPEIAVLDVNLGGGETSLPVAAALRERGTPFVFLTGYTRLETAEDPTILSAPRLKKPVSEHELKSILEDLARKGRKPLHRAPG